MVHLFRRGHHRAGWRGTSRGADRRSASLDLFVVVSIEFGDRLYVGGEWRCGEREHIGDGGRRLTIEADRSLRDVRDRCPCIGSRRDLDFRFDLHTLDEAAAR